MSRAVIALIALSLIPLGVSPGVASDADGCADHPLLGRFPGFEIQRCTHLDFDAHAFLVGAAKVDVEGRSTELLYVRTEGAAEPSRLQVHRNFENAITKAGGVVTGRDDDGGLYLKLAKGGAEVWVHVDAYIPTQYALHIIDKGAMQQEIVADAAALGAGLKAEGRIAIYGVHFDTGKAVVKPDSAPALTEIGKLLAAQPALKLHVVGHTDNVGGLASNMALSKARAEAVVAALTTTYHVAASRLIAHGVGPVAPVASNASDAGRALNRRVELVTQ